jgi:hypothetical protein
MPDPILDKLIRTAIRRRRLLEYRYQNRNRIVEPHDYGIPGGSIKLFTYQLGGSSSKPLPNWRMMFVAGISGAHMMNESFSGWPPCSFRGTPLMGKDIRQGKTGIPEILLSAH